MSIIARILGWLASKAILYVLLVAAMLAAVALLPWARSQWTAFEQHRAVAERLETGRSALHGLAGQAERQTVGKIDEALRAAQAQYAGLMAQDEQRGGAARALSLATGDGEALLADGGRALELRILERKIALLAAARERLVHREGLTDGQPRLQRLTAETLARWPACRAAAQDLRAFEARWPVPALRGLEWREHADLQGKVNFHCPRWRASDQERLALADRLQRLAALEREADAAVQAALGAFDARIAAERARAEGSVLGWTAATAERHGLKAILWAAAGLLAVIIATPFVIRLFCYFVLAPLAMRRPAIRIGGRGASRAAIPAADRSAASASVRLSEGEELLVRDGYLQTTSDSGPKSTQWLLDARHPVTSLATGLTFLTRIRGSGEVTTVSAVRDPFAEVTVMTLPEGAACVLRPRALAAVVQPVARRLRVTGHWRLFSLNAWLSLQLRYLVFHGPVRLVLHGGRGIRIERAEKGRILGQDQVVGFSTDLAYSVTRNETFWPYLLGREPLLRDRVEAGEGVLIIEEAPMAGQRGGGRRRGIEGLLDAALKVFGA